MFVLLSFVKGSLSFEKDFNTIFLAVFHLNNKDVYRNHVLLSHLPNETEYCL